MSRAERSVVSVVIISVLLFGAMVTVLSVKDWIDSRQTCDWCEDPYFGKGVQVWEFYLDKNCFDELQFRSKRIWDNKWDRKRMKWIRQMVKARVEER